MDATYRMPLSRFRSPRRVHESALAGVEKRALVWMAERLPGWVNSDLLTLVGLLSMAGAGAGYWMAGSELGWLWVVNAMIVLNWAGDSLDGTVARVRKRQRPRYGFYVDHVDDAASAVFLLGGLGLSGLMSPMVAAALLVGFLLLAVESFLTTCTMGTFHVSHGLFGPTELRLLLMAGNTALFLRGDATIWGGRALLLDVGGLIGALGMGLMFAWLAGRHTARLYQEERLP
jgi:phosphatidylglycerophosphate synthase